MTGKVNICPVQIAGNKRVAPPPPDVNIVRQTFIVNTSKNFRDGGTEAATFCALTTLCKQLDSWDSMDVYQVAKLYHNKRPGIWRSPVSYTILVPQT